MMFVTGWQDPFGLKSRESLMPVPISPSLKARNTILDKVFYNVSGLTAAEVETLTDATTAEGRILIVHPAGTRGQHGVMPFDDHAAVRANPGDMLEQFCMAGVGSSDLGAAALARDIANATGKPVGAIVAGYGLLDVVAEGLGGWAYLGAMNRLLALMDTTLRAAEHEGAPSSSPSVPDTVSAAAGIESTGAGSLANGWITRDSTALRRFFLDKDRDIRLLVGHSKGCLSIADTMSRLARTGAAAVLTRLDRVRIITLGAVVRFPPECQQVQQYLGALDVLGACNSRGGLPRVLVPQANHHLNTQLPYHVSLGAVLKHAMTGRALWVPRTH